MYYPWRSNARYLGIALVALAALGLSGCASHYPAAPPLAASPDYNYVIGPGDTVNITVWRNPELSMSVPVRPDGKITGPLVEDMPVMGKDATTIAREMEKVISKFVRDPVVTVIVTNFVGPYSEQIRIIGEAARPQALAYRQKNVPSRRDDRRRRNHGVRGWQCGNDSAEFGGQQTIQRPPQGLVATRRRLGECRNETGRRPDHSAKLVLNESPSPNGREFSVRSDEHMRS